MKTEPGIEKPLVMIVWDDAEDPDDGKTWMDQEDVEAFAARHCVVRSVGYLVSKTDKYVTLAADWIEQLGHFGRVTKIPAGMVIAIESVAASATANQEEKPEMK